MSFENGTLLSSSGMSVDYKCSADIVNYKQRLFKLTFNAKWPGKVVWESLKNVEK